MYCFNGISSDNAYVLYKNEEGSLLWEDITDSGNVDTLVFKNILEGNVIFTSDDIYQGNYLSIDLERRVVFAKEDSLIQSWDTHTETSIDNKFIYATYVYENNEAKYLGDSYMQGFANKIDKGIKSYNYEDQIITLNNILAKLTNGGA